MIIPYLTGRLDLSRVDRAQYIRGEQMAAETEFDRLLARLREAPLELHEEVRLGKGGLALEKLTADLEHFKLDVTPLHQLLVMYFEDTISGKKYDVVDEISKYNSIYQVRKGWKNALQGKKYPVILIYSRFDGTETHQHGYVTSVRTGYCRTPSDSFRFKSEDDSFKFLEEVQKWRNRAKRKTKRRQGGK